MPQSYLGRAKLTAQLTPAVRLTSLSPRQTGEMGANQSRDQADSGQEKKVAVEEIFVQKIAYKCGVTEQAEIQPGFVASEAAL